MADVVGEEYVGNMVVTDIVYEVLGEIAAVDDMDVLETIEEVGGKSVAEAVLEDEQATVVACGSGDVRQTVVAAHERAVGQAAAVGIGLEETCL